MSKLSTNHSSVRIFLFILLIFILGIFSFFLSQTNWQESLNLKERITEFGFLAPLFFVLLFAFVSILFVPVYPLSLSAVALFGTLGGLLWTFTGALLGAIISFGVAKYLGSTWLNKLFQKQLKKINPYKIRLEKDSFKTIVVLRLLTFLPFAPLNFSLGLFKISFRDYFFATALGIIPGTIFYVLLGASLFEFNFLIFIFLISFLLLGSLVFGPSLKKLIKK